MGVDGDFDEFDNNEDVTSKADKAYIDELNKITGSGIFPSYSWGRTGTSTLIRMMSNTPYP